MSELTIAVSMVSAVATVIRAMSVHSLIFRMGSCVCCGLGMSHRILLVLTMIKEVVFIQAPQRSRGERPLCRPADLT